MTLRQNGFQSFVNTYMPLGQKGARASMNPRAFVLGGEGDYRADATDIVTVGNFAWLVPGGTAHGAVTSGGIIGFVSNELESLITTYLAQDVLAIPSGLIVPAYTHGDFWAEISGAVAVGDTIYATSTTGAPTTSAGVSGVNPDTGFKAASAVAVDAASSGNVSIAAGTGILTVAATVTGVIQTAQYGQVGDLVSGTGVPDNVFILNQLTGTAGKDGTYQTTLIGAAAVATFTDDSFSHPHLVKISRTY